MSIFKNNASVLEAWVQLNMETIPRFTYKSEVRKKRWGIKKNISIKKKIERRNEDIKEIQKWNLFEETKNYTHFQIMVIDLIFFS